MKELGMYAESKTKLTEWQKKKGGIIFVQLYMKYIIRFQT